MAETPVSPTARRFELARRLKELREESNSTLEDISVVLSCSVAKVSRLESAQRLPTPLDLRVLAEHYELTPEQSDELLALVADARKRGWWLDFRSLDEQVRTYIGLESAARKIRQVEVTKLPGMLQTDAYIEWLIPRLRTPTVFSENEIKDLVAVRRRRRERIWNGEIEGHFILDEATLSRRIGPPSLMLEQVDQLIKVSGLPNVRLQVITFDVGSHPALNEGFTILDFEREAATTVNMEGIAGSYLLRVSDGPQLVERIVETFEIVANMALPENETMDWLQRLKHRASER